ncbi:MAG: hypothetical protein GY866_20990 [Proteobacteria bacterium]|nr:hypothetical protein [Pseudomonadota bacterium]
MKVNVLGPDQIAAFQKVARPAGLQFVKKVGGQQFVDELLQAIDKAERKLGYK